MTLTDVILRNFGHPITGSMEIIQYGGSVVFGFSVPYATFLKAQVQVDLILNKLKPGPRRTLNIITRASGSSSSCSLPTISSCTPGTCSSPAK